MLLMIPKKSSISVQFSKHATHSSTTDSLDGIYITVNNAINVFQYQLPLWLKEAIIGLAGHRQNLGASRVFDLQHIPTEAIHLFSSNGQHFVRFGKVLQKLEEKNTNEHKKRSLRKAYVLALVQIFHGFETNNC
jgi:hypothetical protein